MEHVRNAANTSLSSMGRRECLSTYLHIPTYVYGNRRGMDDTVPGRNFPSKLQVHVTPNLPNDLWKGDFLPSRRIVIAITVMFESIQLHKKSKCQSSFCYLSCVMCLRFSLELSWIREICCPIRKEEFARTY